MRGKAMIIENTFVFYVAKITTKNLVCRIQKCVKYRIANWQWHHQPDQNTAWGYSNNAHTCEQP